MSAIAKPARRMCCIINWAGDTVHPGCTHILAINRYMNVWIWSHLRLFQAFPSPAYAFQKHEVSHQLDKSESLRFTNNCIFPDAEAIAQACAAKPGSHFWWTILVDERDACFRNLPFTPFKTWPLRIDQLRSRKAHNCNNIDIQQDH